MLIITKKDVNEGISGRHFIFTELLFFCESSYMWDLGKFRVLPSIQAWGLGKILRSFSIRSLWAKHRASHHMYSGTYENSSSMERPWVKIRNNKTLFLFFVCKKFLYHKPHTLLKFNCLISDEEGYGQKHFTSMRMSLVEAS